MTLYCSFCGRPQTEVFHMISSPENHIVKVYICDECVDTCSMIIDREYAKEDHTDFYDELAQSLFPK